MYRRLKKFTWSELDYLCDSFVTDTYAVSAG